MAAAKNPERVRLGRIGALTVHARGRTNTGPARLAWEAALADEFGITDDLPAAERKRRLDLAMRVRMSNLARSRWGKRKGIAAIEPAGDAQGGLDATDASNPRAAA